MNIFEWKSIHVCLKTRTLTTRSYNLKKDHIKDKDFQGQTKTDKKTECKVRPTSNLISGKQGGFNNDNCLFS